MMSPGPDGEDLFPPSQQWAMKGNTYAMTPAPGAQGAGAAGPGHEHGKTFNDPIHHHFHLPKDCIDIIDTPEFQRLRDIKQLGTSYYVFPGASHNRFEHSLGVCHLADKMIKGIRMTQKDELDLDGHDERIVRLAGLCHDLGHAPFSHLFDNEFLPRSKWMQEDPEACREWKHERMSTEIFDLMVDKNYLDYSDRVRRGVKDIIMGSEDEFDVKAEKAYLKQIVANGLSSVDVDKFDYIQRDCYYSGVSASCNFDRFFQNIKILDNQICFKASEAHNLNDLFYTRQSLFRKVYTHRKGKAIEYMVVDAMIEADPVFNFSAKATDPKEYVKLDDTILKQIEWGTDPALGKAQEIIERLRKRQLYRYVNEVIVPGTHAADWKAVAPEDITTHQDPSGVAGEALRPEDIIIHNVKYDWGKRDQYPLDYMKFYSKHEDGPEDLFRVREGSPAPAATPPPPPPLARPPGTGGGLTSRPDRSGGAASPGCCRRASSSAGSASSPGTRRSRTPCSARSTPGRRSNSARSWRRPNGSGSHRPRGRTRGTSGPASTPAAPRRSRPGSATWPSSHPPNHLPHTSSSVTRITIQLSLSLRFRGCAAAAALPMRALVPGDVPHLTARPRPGPCRRTIATRSAARGRSSTPPASSREATARSCPPPLPERAGAQPPCRRPTALGPPRPRFAPPAARAPPIRPASWVAGGVGGA